MDETREASIRRPKHPSFGEEGKVMELQETVKRDHDGSFPIISKRKRDPLRAKENAGNEHCGFSRKLSSDHNQQRINGIRENWTSIVVPKKARSPYHSPPKKTSKCSETEIAELLYGLKASRSQDSSEKLETNGIYDYKSYVPKKDIIKRVNLESIDLMAPPKRESLSRGEFTSETRASTTLGTNETKMDKFKMNKRDNDILINHQVNKTVSPAWSGNLSPLGCFPPSLQPIVKTDKTIQLVDFVLSPPQPKRCASHHYIARNILLHQLLRGNHIQPGPANSSSLCGTKPDNVNDVPTPESMIIGQQSQNDLPGVKGNAKQVKKSPDASISQTEQQGPYIMHQASPTSHARGASSSNNSSLVSGSSTSIGLSSSQRVQVKANNVLCSSVAQPQHKLMTEKSPSIVGQNNVYSQSFTIPIQPKKQEAFKAGFELVSSQSFAISFHSQPSVAWQGYHQTSSLTSTYQYNGNKVTSANSPTTLVSDDSSKYLSFVLSPKNETWLDHSQHLLQLHKQQQPPMVTQYEPSSSTTSVTEHVSNSSLSPKFPHCNSRNPSFHLKSSTRPLDYPKIAQEQGRVLQGHAQISFWGNYKLFPPLQVQRQLNNNQSSNITFARYLPSGSNSKTSKVCSNESSRILINQGLR